MEKRKLRTVVCCLLVGLLFLGTSTAWALEETDPVQEGRSAYIPVVWMPVVAAESQGGTKYKITVTNLPWASQVQIPTWSEADGQDDIVWYTAANHGNGTWVAAVDAAPHGGGTMVSHVYADGMMVGACNYSAPSVSRPVVTVEELGSTRYKITAYNLSWAQKVQVPTWSEANGQDDIVWHNAAYDGNGVWSTYVNSTPHGGGKMVSHVYADGRPVGSITYVAPETPQISVAVEPLGGSRFRITAHNLTWASKVLMPTWSVKNGKDDIAWYTAGRNADGSWSAVIDADPHGGGEMLTHVYADDKPIGSASFLAPDVPEPTVTAEHLSGSRYRIQVHNLTWPTEVRVPTWSEENGQDDIAWYEAEYDGYGTWTAVVDTAPHGGGYMISHVYADGRPVGAVTYVTDYIDKPTVRLESLGGSKYRVVIRDLPHAVNVQVPTWNETTGTSSTIWYKAQYVGDGVWHATINAADLGPGRIISYIYADGRKVGETQAVFQYTT